MYAKWCGQVMADKSVTCLYSDCRPSPKGTWFKNQNMVCCLLGPVKKRETEANQHKLEPEVEVI